MLLGVGSELFREDTPLYFNGMLSSAAWCFLYSLSKVGRMRHILVKHKLQWPPLPLCLPYRALTCLNWNVLFYLNRLSGSSQLCQSAFIDGVGPEDRSRPANLYSFKFLYNEFLTMRNRISVALQKLTEYSRSEWTVKTLHNEEGKDQCKWY